MLEEFPDRRPMPRPRAALLALALVVPLAATNAAFTAARLPVGSRVRGDAEDRVDRALSTAGDGRPAPSGQVCVMFLFCLLFSEGVGQTGGRIAQCCMHRWMLGSRCNLN
jgi:hypothetical protein